MLIIVNPEAALVSTRLKNLVVYALQGRYEVFSVDTEERNHATLMGLEIRDGYDVIVAFGGDGTFNEIANAFGGTDVPISVLPGGSANIACRALGVPSDIVDATEHLLDMASEWRPRQIDLGKVGGRYFATSCGAGIDAATIKQISKYPRITSHFGHYYVSLAAIARYYHDYQVDPVNIRVTTGNDEELEGISAVAQNSRDFTYFGERPIQICRGVGLEDGALAFGVLQRSSLWASPTMIGHILRARKPASSHRKIRQLSSVTAATVESTSATIDGTTRPFPVQVDGDYIGERARLELSVSPGALTVVA